MDLKVVIERDAEGTFVTSVRALRGYHTQAKSLDELIERIQEAIALCLGFGGPSPDSLAFFGLQRVHVA